MRTAAILLYLFAAGGAGSLHADEGEPEMHSMTPSIRTYAWHREMDQGSHEQAVVSRTEASLRIEGRILAVEPGEVPIQVDYALDSRADGLERSLQLRLADPGGERRLSLWRDSDGNWWRNGQPAPELAGCSDVDLEWSPSTNAIPINRMLRDNLDSTEIRAAWVRFPTLDVEAASQHYTRLDTQRWQYDNQDSSFTAELEVDDWGLPRRYAGIWRQTAMVESPVELAGSGFAGALLATGPLPELAGAADDFAWLVGGWHAEVRDFNEDGSVRTAQGEWWFSWVLEGRAMQDVWISPPRAARGVPGAGAANRYGTSLRTFVSENGRWRVRWFNPVSGAENQLEGGRHGGSIILTGLADGHSIRWQFVDIRANRFTWEAFRLASDGEVWEPQARFELSRIR